MDEAVMACGPEPSLRIGLIGEFSALRQGDMLRLPPPAQRLVAYLALNRRHTSRCTVAASLWPDLGEPEGLCRLRDVVYKLKSVAPRLVGTDPQRIRLRDDVGVDLEVARGLARDLLDPGRREDVPAAVELFTQDLLPGWDEEWLAEDREAFLMLRLRALEQLARQRLEAARFHDAERACRSIIRAEPYRETARILLARLHLVEGNAGEALRDLLDFAEELERDLGLPASQRVRDLATSIRAGR